MNIHALMLLPAIAGMGAYAQIAIHIHVNQPRPFEAALDQLERAIGIPINYEDPRFVCSTEVQDVTAQVQNAAQQAAHPNARIIVPKAGIIGFDSVLNATPQAGDALAIVTELRVQYEAKGYPGRFTVKQVGSVLTVEPSAARGTDCAWAAATPVMETKISFPTEAREASEALVLILKTLTERLGVKVGLGHLPMMAFVHRNVTLGANDEAANSVLVRLFEQLSPSGQSNYSYHLFYDPGLKYYLADIGAVRPVAPRTQPQTPVPPPPSGGAFGSRPTNQ